MKKTYPDKRDRSFSSEAEMKGVEPLRRLPDLSHFECDLFGHLSTSPYLICGKVAEKMRTDTHCATSLF